METIFVAGLPRSGSTLLCNLMSQHPDVKASESSPLCHIIQNMKRQWSDDHFLLAQLDHNFDNVYKRLSRCTKAFMESWCQQDEPCKFYLDKNRGWLAAADMVRSMYPDMKIVVCLRDLRSIFASIEKIHRETLLIDFPDHMDANIVDGRADSLFGNSGVVGGPLRALNNIGDVPWLGQHIYHWRYEDFTTKPEETMADLLKWLGADNFTFNLNKIEQVTHESDSYYRFKYPHKIKEKFEAGTDYRSSMMSPRIMREIVDRFGWYYSKFYPDAETTPKTTANAGPSLTETETQVLKEVEEALTEGT